MRNLVSKVEDHLVSNLLNFWLNKAIDKKSSLPYGEVGSSGFQDNTLPIGGILSARILWSFSAAYNILKKKEYLDAADSAAGNICKYFRDKKTGAVVFSINPDGTICDKTLRTDTQCYALYGFVEHFTASADPKSLKCAEELYRMIEEYAFLGNDSGYAEFIDPDKNYDAAQPRTLNTHLHILESYVTYYKINPDNVIRDKILFLFDKITGPFYADGFFYTSVFSDWTRLSDDTWYGLNLETVWLIYDAVTVIGDTERIKIAEKILLESCDFAISNSIDSDGGVYYQGNGAVPVNTDKEWWPQAESSNAFLLAYEITKDNKYSDQFAESWDFIFSYLADEKTGDWKKGVTKDRIDFAEDIRSGLWKCPYHNTRAAFEVIKRKDSLNF